MAYSKIYIVGPNQFTSQLMGDQIQQVAPIPISCTTDHSQIDGIILGQEDLVICDCNQTDPAEHCSRMSHVFGVNGNAPGIVFINVSHATTIFEELIHYNIHGVLYRDDSIEMIKKAVVTILGGDYWLSRKLLVESLKSVRHGYPVLERTAITPSHPSHALTSREQEIVGLIAAGMSNLAISSSLFISPSTVKTHISNIYKKIDVSNRVQAILWAAKNLDKDGDKGAGDPDDPGWDHPVR